MTEQKKHPNYEFIVAFAEGKQLQVRAKNGGVWMDLDSERHAGPWEASGMHILEWRVKPESRWYRVASFRDANGKFWTESADSGTLDEEVFTTDGEFVKWLTDRVEYNV